MFKSKIFMVTLILLFSFSFNALSTESVMFGQRDIVSEDKAFTMVDDPKYFTIGSIEITELSTGVIEEKSLSGSIGSIVMTIDKLIAAGKKIWAIVEAGKPVISAKFNPISVIPNSDDPNMVFSQMAGWSMPKTKKYEVVYKNLYGGEVVRFEFMVVFQHGGKFKNKGSYITGLNIVPTTINATWGYKFYAKSELMAISNMGSTNDPVAGATINLNYITKTPIKESNASVVFHIAGDGRIIKL